jgi:hypothetical protein
MTYYVSNKSGELGKKVEADSPEEAATKSKLKGDKDVRWNVKFGEPGKPATGGPWWFAETLAVRDAKPKATTKKKAEATAESS